MYLGSTENMALQSAENNSNFFTELNRQNPPVLELGLPPLRMSIPIHSKGNLKLGIYATAGVVTRGLLGVGAFFGRRFF